MGAYLFKKIFILLVTLLLVSAVIFAVLMVIPSDPAQIVLGIHATPETLQALRHKMGLDRPVIIQYVSYIKNMIGIDEDGTPACVVVCPAGARLFGDLNDPDSLVSQALRDYPSFQLREDLGTKPRVYYLPAREEVSA